MHLSSRAFVSVAGKDRKNLLDHFYEPANYDLKELVSDEELVEVALTVHADLEEAGFGPEEIRRVARVLSRLSETRAGGRN